MQQLNGKTESRTTGADNTPPFLTNTIFIGGKNRMASQNISKFCSMEECDRPVKGKGYCNLHYKRVWRYGSPFITKHNFGIGKTPEERFWSRVDKTSGLGPTGECWEWQGKITHHFGYGKVTINGNTEMVHRAAWILSKGIYPRLFILHSCDNPRCVNPAHLREGTKKDNSQDAIKRNRMPIGAQRPNAILNDAKAHRIKVLRGQGVKLKQIAVLLDIAEHLVVGVIYGKSWRHVKDI